MAEVSAGVTDRVLAHLAAGEYDEAREYCLTEVGKDASVNALIHDLGIVFLQLGRNEQSREMFERSLEVDPGLTPSHYALATLKRYTEHDEQVQQMLRLYDDSSLSTLQRSYLGLALAKAARDLGDTESFEAMLMEANRLRRSLYPFAVEQAKAFFKALKRHFPVANEKPAPKRELQPVPIFVLGMPRSGTTLTEQILDCHPAVGAIGESNYFAEKFDGVSRQLGGEFPHWMNAVSEDALAALGQEYLDYLRQRCPDARYVVEKTPYNFSYIGVIRAALPGARFIHCDRDPRDSCFSMYQRSFHAGDHLYAYNQLDLARFHHLYADLMDHWHRAYPDDIHRQSYEALVQDLEPGVRRLLDFVGLDFHEACLSPHENKRVVSTASVNQVRQPLYTSSIGTWKPYKRSLEVLLAALEAAPTDALHPDWSEAHISQLTASENAESNISGLQAVASQQPLYLPARKALVQQLKILGRYEEALQHAQVAAELDPDNAARHYQLGSVYFALNRHSSAIAALQCAIELRPGAFRSHGLLAFIYCLRQEYSRSAQHLRIVLDGNDRESYALAAWCRLAAQEGKASESLLALQRLMENEIEEAPPWMAAADAMLALCLYQRAEEVIRRGLHHAPKDARLHNQLGLLLSGAGRREEAIGHYEEALVQEPEFGNAWYKLAYIADYSTDDEQVQRMYALFRAEHTSQQSKIFLAFALALVLDRAGDTAQAWKMLEAGNSERYSATGAECDKELRDLGQWRDSMRSINLNPLQGQADDSPGPLFLLGMPRSGSSLAEGILSAHPAVTGAGELNYLSQLLPRYAGEAGVDLANLLCTADEKQLQGLQHDYLELLSLHAADGLVTDKMPGNFLFLPVILQAFPNAKIIHCQRDPMDTCFSMLQMHLGGGSQHAYSFDQRHLGEYYRFYHAFLAEWDERCPGAIYSLSYEALIADTEGQVRALLDYCSLDFDSACLEFHQSERTVYTASMNQVRQPVYSSSIGRWKPYAKYLQPLADALEIDIGDAI